MCILKKDIIYIFWGNQTNKKNKLLKIYTVDGFTFLFKGIECPSFALLVPTKSFPKTHVVIRTHYIIYTINIITQ